MIEMEIEYWSNGRKGTLDDFTDSIDAAMRTLAAELLAEALGDVACPVHGTRPIIVVDEALSDPTVSGECCAAMTAAIEARLKSAAEG
jgi:catabolite regulation protein CreA